MRHINDWCKDKPLPVQLAAKTYIPQIGGLVRVINEMRKGAICNSLPKPDADLWRNMYRRKKMLNAFQLVLDSLQVELPINQTINDARNESLRLTQGQSNIEQINLQEKGLDALITGSPVMLNVFALFQGFINQSLIERMPSASKQSDMELTPELSCILQFFCKVLIPCGFIYGEQPSRLLYRARNGNLDALDALLRLDKTIISEPRIAGHWNAIMMSVNRPLIKRMQAAFIGDIRPALSPKKVKMISAAYVMIAAEMCNYRLVTEELVDLFNAIARDFEGKPADYEIPDNEQAVYKAVKREVANLRTNRFMNQMN